MLPEWTQRLAEPASQLDGCLDRVFQRLHRRSTSDSPVQIVPYRGFGNAREIHVWGRVLLESKTSSAGEGTLLNLLATYRRFHSREVPGKQVVARIQNHRATAVTNNEGFFAATLPNPHGRTMERWQTLSLEADGGAAATGRVFVPPASAKFGIISDLDDTVVVSHATNLVKMLGTLLFKDARGRVAFPGVAAFYRALEGDARNPFFYVSSGPWNLYDLIVDFLELNQIPAGPVFLQDYGLERDRFISATHDHHKSEHIERILQLHPDLPFILIGDSGQRDPEIYAEFLRRCPERILAIYIRDVTEDRRDAIVRKLGGTEMILVQDSSEAARHAAARGFIAQAALAEVDRDKQDDLQLTRQGWAEV